MIDQVMKKEVTYDMCKDWNQYSEEKRGKKGKEKKITNVIRMRRELLAKRV